VAHPVFKTGQGRAAPGLEGSIPSPRRPVAVADEPSIGRAEVRSVPWRAGPDRALVSERPRWTSRRGGGCRSTDSVGKRRRERRQMLSRGEQLPGFHDDTSVLARDSDTGPNLLAAEERASGRVPPA
jgi:hypothetical protein